MRPLDRLRPRPDPVEADELAVEARLVLGPERLHRPTCSSTTVQRRLRRNAMVPHPSTSGPHRRRGRTGRARADRRRHGLRGHERSRSATRHAPIPSELRRDGRGGAARDERIEVAQVDLLEVAVFRGGEGRLARRGDVRVLGIEERARTRAPRPPRHLGTSTSATGKPMMPIFARAQSSRRKYGSRRRLGGSTISIASPVGWSGARCSPTGRRRRGRLAAAVISS